MRNTFDVSSLRLFLLMILMASTLFDDYVFRTCLFAMESTCFSDCLLNQLINIHVSEVVSLLETLFNQMCNYIPHLTFKKKSICHQHRNFSCGLNQQKCSFFFSVISKVHEQTLELTMGKTFTNNLG